MTSTGGGPTATFPQILNVVRIRGLQRRRQPEQDAGDYGDQESEKKHARANVNFVEPWNIRGREAYDRILQEKDYKQGDCAGD
jgi:hypothetical protein